MRMLIELVLKAIMKNGKQAAAFVVEFAKRVPALAAKLKGTTQESVEYILNWASKNPKSWTIVSQAAVAAGVEFGSHIVGLITGVVGSDTSNSKAAVDALAIELQKHVDPSLALFAAERQITSGDGADTYHGFSIEDVARHDAVAAVRAAAQDLIEQTRRMTGFSKAELFVLKRVMALEDADFA